jgi:dihydroxyacetone kinase DhaKLM complex PTS-EIIA-like component DhaM
MNARYWPCFGVKSRRESEAGFIVVLDSGGSAMNIRYRVDLSDIERTQLTALLNGGKHAARKIKRAQILLAANAGVSDDVIASSPLGWRIDGLPNQAALR